MIVNILEWAAWIISAGLGGWMLLDAFRVGRTYDEEFLTTSVEGIDDLLEANESAGGAR